MGIKNNKAQRDKYNSPAQDSRCLRVAGLGVCGIELKARRAKFKLYFYEVYYEA